MYNAKTGKYNSENRQWKVSRSLIMHQKLLQPYLFISDRTNIIEVKECYQQTSSS
jgi:hypothetical protein